jgi:hypothetical protein
VPHKVWNGESSNFVVGKITSLPVGYQQVTCPNCGQSRLTGAIIHHPDGKPVIPGSDDADPNLLCLSCGFWADAFDVTSK